MRIFEELESNVRGYIRSFPVVFDKADGALLYDENGGRYIDFFAGAGTLNYGHNNPRITKALIAYLEQGGIVHGLDKATVAKRRFLETLQKTIFEPRNLHYKVQFTGPTGTNAVESALKLARIIKRRGNIIAFTNGYHGLTMGSLSVTGNTFYRNESYSLPANTDFMPFDGYFGPDVDTIAYLRRYLEDPSSGVERPAAIIVETVQGEGGINVSSPEWLKALEQLCREFDILLIIDDIQMGNGRTGPFFSFEHADIAPDMVTVSKAVGGGLPLALLLMRPDLDQWQPGEHTGTFRGNNLGFVAATEALSYWEDDSLTRTVESSGAMIEKSLRAIVKAHPALENAEVRGRGMAWGLDFKVREAADKVSTIAFRKGLVIETSGADSSVLKLLPPLVTDPALLEEGLAIIHESVAEFLEPKTVSFAQGEAA